MSVHRNSRTHSPFKKDFNRIGDSYNSYINTYKTHNMSTQQGDLGQSPEEITPNQRDEIETLHNFWKK